jgi:hypothetical protein
MPCYIVLMLTLVSVEAMNSQDLAARALELGKLDKDNVHWAQQYLTCEPCAWKV